MPSYQVLLKEMLFTLNEIIGVEDVADLETYSDATPGLAEAILDEADKYMRDVVAPINFSGDVEGAKWSPEGVTSPKGYKEACDRLVETGWIDLLADPSFGGQGLPQSLFSPVQEMLCGANLVFAQSPTLTIGAYEAQATHGSDELKQRFMPKLVSGEWQETMNLTESHAGSDVGAQ